MALGAAVPVFDGRARAVAALSVGTPTERLNAGRLTVVVALLQREARVRALARAINTFDKALRRACGGGVGGMTRGAPFASDRSRVSC